MRPQIPPQRRSQGALAPPVQHAQQAMRQMLQAGAALQGQVEALVHAQRLAGASWADVGRLLGTTRQAAHRRWRYLEDRRVFIMRAPNGELFAQGEDTGAVVWMDQTDQVRKHGVIIDHHPRTEGRLALAATAFAVDGVPSA